MKDTIPPSKEFVIRTKRVAFHNAKVMAILNCTPDSFSDGGKYINSEAALEGIAQMVASGASIIDVGGESTRPGSDPVSVSEELQRVIPILEKAIPLFPDTLFSVDTTKFEVAQAALLAGVHFVNDVSGLRKEPRFPELCTESNAGLIIMHSIGDPKTMQNAPSYTDVVSEVRDYLVQKAEVARKAGVSCVIIDPGIGFGKSLEHNLSLIKHTSAFVKTGYPVLMGVSRKSMFGQLLDGRPASGRVTATVTAHLFSILQGASIIRVHDVQEASDSIKVLEAIRTAN